MACKLEHNKTLQYEIDFGYLSKFYLMTNIPKQLKTKRWSIFINNEVAAYISCPEACKKIAASLRNYSSKAHNISIVEENV